MKTNYIYIFITNESKKIKIGVTNNIESRLKNIQTGNPEIVEVYYFAERDDAYKIEKMLHRHFCKNKTTSNGEWFCDISPLDVRRKMIEYFV